MDYEPIDKAKFWLVEEKPKRERDYNELENLLAEQPRGSEHSTKLSKG